MCSRKFEGLFCSCNNGPYDDNREVANQKMTRKINLNAHSGDPKFLNHTWIAQK